MTIQLGRAIFLALGIASATAAQTTAPDAKRTQSTPPQSGPRVTIRKPAGERPAASPARPGTTVRVLKFKPSAIAAGLKLELRPDLYIKDVRNMGNGFINVLIANQGQGDAGPFDAVVMLRDENGSVFRPETPINNGGLALQGLPKGQEVWVGVLSWQPWFGGSKFAASFHISVNVPYEICTKNFEPPSFPEKPPTYTCKTIEQKVEESRTNNNELSVKMVDLKPMN